MDHDGPALPPESEGRFDPGVDRANAALTGAARDAGPARATIGRPPSLTES